MKKIYFLIFFPFLIYAQDKDSLKPDLEFTVNTQYGQVMKSNFYVKTLDNLEYGAATFMVSKQTHGEKQWQRKYGNPTFGIGVTAFDFMKHQEFGNPIAVFANYTATAKKWNHLHWNYWTNFGISFNSNIYQYPEYTNPSLSSKTNMYIGVGTSINYELSKHWDIGLGIGLHHFSNGATNTPNKGQNFGAPQLSISYRPNERDTKISDSVKNEKYDRFNTVELSGFYGRKEAHYKGVNRTTLPDPYSGFKYNIYGLEALYTKQFSYKSSWGIGLGLIYDEEYNYNMFVNNGVLYQEKSSDNNRYLISIFPTYRLNMSRMKIDFSMGYYPFKKKEEYNEYKFFQRVALRYFVTDRLFLSFGINASDFHRANYLEWKMGYSIFKKKRD